MRIRTIKPDFFKHDGMAALPPLTRLLFIGLWGMADCAGRLEDRPQRIKVEILPYDDVEIEGALTALADAKFIVRYNDSGVSLIQIPNFRKHQRITGKEAESESKLSPPPGFDEWGNTRETSGKQLRRQEGKGREGKGIRKGKEGARAPVASPPVPLLLSTPEFTEAWERWIRIRTAGKKPSTPWDEFFGEQLKWLEKLGSPERATESILQSIRSGWQGLFEPKNEAKGTRQIGQEARKGTNPYQRSAPTAEDHAKGFFHGIDTHGRTVSDENNGTPASK